MAHTVVDAICVHHRVTVLCGRPSYDPTERRPWSLYQTEKDGLVSIIRVGSALAARVVMSRCLERTNCVPMFCKRKQPVP